MDLIEAERKRSSFSSRNLTYHIYDGEDKVKERERLCSIVANDPTYRMDDLYFLDRSEQHVRALKRAIGFYRLVKELNIREDDERYAWLYDETQSNYANPLGLHNTMFIPTIKGQGTPEQQSKWLPLAYSYKITGTYAQTEMAHGTFIRGLETTSTYDKSTQEFILHSPTLTSTKWWPGGLGISSTHCIIMARLIIDGKDYGIHAFIVQIRSLENHKPMPGVTLGDIGPKFGFNTNDNGFLRVDHVRIPRDQMLMRFAKVNPDGTYEKPQHDKASYGTMVYVRQAIVVDAAKWLAQSLTISIRYSVVRKQGVLLNKQEQQLLDYKTQQYRLFNLLSIAFAMHFTGKEMGKLYKELVERLAKADFSTMAETHATSAGLKALCTSLTADGIEECRKCCGGHGYSNLSGLPALFVQYVPSCTYEGDNYVLLQQTARYLVKAVGAAFQGKQLSGNAKYLQEVKIALNEKSHSEDLLDPQVQLAAFKHRAIRMTAEVASQLKIDEQSKEVTGESWNEHMVALCNAARSHCYLILLKSFQEGVQSCPNELKPVLKRLCDLFALVHFETNKGDFLEDGYFNQKHVRSATKLINQILAELRPDAVALVDAWNFSDRRLNSALGRKDGNVYQTLYDWAQNEPLNKGGAERAYEQVLKATLQAKL